MSQTRKWVSNISILLQNHHQTNYSYNRYMVLYTSLVGKAWWHRQTEVSIRTTTGAVRSVMKCGFESSVWLKCIWNENFDIGFFAFSENLVFSDHKNSNQKFVNFTIKVRFWDYLQAKFLTFHRAASDVCSVTQFRLGRIGFLSDFEENSNESTFCRHRFQCIDTI
jgi:hypothetical protein